MSSNKDRYPHTSFVESKNDTDEKSSIPLGRNNRKRSRQQEEEDIADKVIEQLQHDGLPHCTTNNAHSSPIIQNNESIIAAVYPRGTNSPTKSKKNDVIFHHQGPLYLLCIILQRFTGMIATNQHDVSYFRRVIMIATTVAAVAVHYSLFPINLFYMGSLTMHIFNPSTIIYQTTTSLVFPSSMKMIHLTLTTEVELLSMIGIILQISFMKIMLTGEKVYLQRMKFYTVPFHSLVISFHLSGMIFPMIILTSNQLHVFHAQMNLIRSIMSTKMSFLGYQEWYVLLFHIPVYSCHYFSFLTLYEFLYY